MSLQQRGTIHKIGPVEVRGESFQMRDLILSIVDGNYIQYARFQFTQARCDLLDSFKEGETVTVHFNLRGREWNGKFLTNLDAWRIQRDGEGQVPMPAPEAALPSETYTPPPGGEIDWDAVPKASAPPVEIEDDLPF